MTHKFFTRKTCSKMQAIGCVSESGFYWCYEWDINEKRTGEISVEYIDIIEFNECERHKICQAFTAFDFIAPSEIARKNAEIRWGEGVKIVHQTWEGEVVTYNYGNLDGIPTIGGHPLWKYLRHRIIDLPSEEEVEAYILKGLE